MRLQVGAGANVIDNIYCAGDEAAATVSPFMREMRETERAVEAVTDMIGSQSAMGATGVSVSSASPHFIVQESHKCSADGSSNSHC